MEAGSDGLNVRPGTTGCVASNVDPEDGSVAKIVKLEHACGDWTDGTMTDFKWRHFQGDVILWAVRWYCRYPISYRDLEAMLAERGISDRMRVVRCKGVSVRVDLGGGGI